MKDIGVIHRGRVHDIPNAHSTRIGANAWQIRFEVTPTLERRVRRGARPEDWDGAVFVIGDDQTEPAIGSGQEGDTVLVTVLVL